MNLLDYLEQPPAQQHSATSRAAAGEIAGAAGILRKRLYDYIKSCGFEGTTDEQAQIALDMPGNTCRPRRCELLKAGVIRDSGRNRPTRSGRKAVVWCAVVNPEPIPEL